MISQPLFDALADALVEAGRPVSYTTMQQALVANRGGGTSDRDLKRPYADWLRRRRYRPHLALLDLPLDMEKAIAAFVGLSTRQADDRAAARHAGVEDALKARIAELELRVAELTAGNRALEAAARRPERRRPPDVMAAVPRAIRKRGTSAATSRFFWSRVVSELAAVIKRTGAQDIDQLLASIPPDDAELAAAAFRPIDRANLEKALGERTVRGRHRLIQLEDGRYDLLPAPLRANR